MGELTSAPRQANIRDMNTSPLIRIVSRWLLAIAACVPVFLANSASAAEQRPNIIVVFIDDLGWGDFSCFGNREAKTPEIDRLAAEGIRFSQFYVNAPICSPSRCALLTGQYPQRWRITSFLNNRADNERRGVAQWLDPAAPTVARLLKEHGYATGHFGKWHLGGQRDVDDAPEIAKYGFDASLTNFEGMGAKLLPLTLKPGDTEPGKIWADAERLGKPVTWMQRSEITTGFVDAAIAFLDDAQKAGKPCFVNVWPDDVHSPFWPPVDQWAETKRGMYLAVLGALDNQLGKLCAHVRDNPQLRDNTLIVLCSDNGPEPGAGSAGPFRGTKGTLYEGGIRSPLIVWGPGLVAKESWGTHNAESVFAAFDIAPSLLSLAKVAVPESIKLDGEDVAPVLLGKSTASRVAPLCWRRPPDRKLVPAAAPPAQPDLAIRSGPWKLLCDYDGARPQLYDLQVDREETKNLAGAEPERVQVLTEAVLAWHRSLPADRGPELGAEALKSPAQPKNKKQGKKK